MEKSLQMLTELENVFRLCDENKDGFISIDKFSQLIKKHINYESISDEDMRQMISCFDPQGSGVITLSDFCDGVSSLIKPEDTTSPQVESDIFSSNSVDSGFASNLFDINSTIETKSESSITYLSLDNEIMSRDLFAGNSDQMMTEFDNIQSEDTTDSTILYEPQRLSPSLGLSDTEEHFVFTPENGDDSHEKVQIFNSEGFQFGSNNSANNNSNGTNGSSRQGFQQRNTWLRSSLRRSGSNSNHSSKRISSSAHHANQLFRSSPTNGTSPASRRSSLSCESDDMTNDAITIEEDVMNLTQKIQVLQEQVNQLSEGQISNEDKYTRVKQENANLLTKIHTLEEQLREIEIQSEDRREEEQRRYKDVMARHEREKSQECEQYINRIYGLQQELLEAKDESRKYQNIIERLKSVKIDLEEQLQEKTAEIDSLRVEVDKLRDVVRRHQDEENVNNRLIEVLNQELTDIRKPQLFESKKRTMSSSDEIDVLINSEMEKELKQLKDENLALREANEELSALLLNNRLEEGRILLKEGEVVSSLASEMSNLNLDQLRVALKEQQDVNVKLRTYIDGILLNIVENYPQLLEVKTK